MKSFSTVRDTWRDSQSYMEKRGPALSRFKPLRFRFSGTPQRCRFIWACILYPSQVRAAQVTRCLLSAVTPRWAVGLIASPIPAARFSGCTMGVPSQVCRVSLLGSWSLAVTLRADVNHSESQELLVSNGACLQFGKGCLSGVVIALFRLWLPHHHPPACLRQGWAGPQSASSPLVFAQSFVLWAGLAVPQVRAFHRIVLSLFFNFFLSLAIPQFELLSHVSSLRLPSGHSSPVLTLSNAALASLFSPLLLVAAASAGSCH